LFDEELVLLGEDGAPFLEPHKPKAYVIRGKAWVNNHAHVLRAKAVPTGWLVHFLNFVRYEGLVTGTTRLKLTQAAMRQIRVPVAPWEVMERTVADIEKQFSRLDEAVANLKRAKVNLKRCKAAVLKAAVEGRLVPTEAEIAGREGRSYETSSQLLARLVQERRRAWRGKGTYRDPEGPEAGGLPPLPEGWAWARLDAVAALKGGITVDKKRRDSTARSVPYLRVANVQRGYLDLEEIKQIQAPQADIEELRLKPGDILFNEGGDRDKLGRGWIWEGQLAECIHQNHVFRARPYSADISGKLISWWGNTFGKDYFIREGKQTTNLASINMTKLSAFPVLIPPIAEQRRIVAEVDRRLSIVGEVEAEVDANMKRAQALRQAVLTRAFVAQP
jgi:type I restriction enzyme S subunit